ncbi:hypothetical protein AWM79_08995 [Pseudomonas agarici]|uniref:Polysaccharide biosynthesis protein n=1 Tax=Pseudomonas agarici TaxID=46677 RepID=A0A0X1T027_PSEAA|nr:oligosaccharide flippase family protein [Pseudomonas agarici]AMB85434.1 hypothetical protein AWM79_08995 [Pseudomonas agarici]NWB91924.1 oligosaccharide flippase family protein [Pseudomonas agarici]
MPKQSVTRIINIALRGITLASKFLLIFFLAKFLEPKELGLYGLLTATISYALYFLGFDFYTFTTREIIKRERHEWGGLIKDQGALSLLLYVIVLPLLSFVFINGLLPWRVAGWFFILLVLEHLTQELGRLLIAISEQLLASLVLFLRSGIWAVMVTAVMFFRTDTRDLDFVLGGWTLGSLVALLLGIHHLKQLDTSGWHKKIDWRWIGKGLKVSIPLLIATLAIRGIFTVDRYWFADLMNLETLGAYVLFMGISSALLSFLDAGVFSFIYPGLIGAHHNKDSAAFCLKLRALLLQTLLLSGAFIAITLLIIDPLLAWLDKPLYIENKSLFPWTLLITLLYSVGMVPHYALYAQGLDRPIIHSHIASLLIFIPSTWLFSKFWPLQAVPLGLCVAFFLILLWKSLAFVRMTPPQYRSLSSAPKTLYKGTR